MARIRIQVGELSYWADAIQAAGFQISQNSFAADTLQFSIPRALSAARLFPDRATIQIFQGNDRAFYGQIRATPIAGTPARSSHIVNASGGWWWLEQLTYEQQARRLLNGSLQDVLLSSVVLGRVGSTDASQTCGAVIKAMIDFAHDKGALVTAGTISAGPEFPEEEGTDITCAEGVIRSVRWMPDAVPGFDHATGLLNCSTVPAVTHQVDLRSTAYRVDIVDPAPRQDLVIPGVRIDFVITGSYNGRTVLEMVREVAGDPELIGGIKHTMSIRGNSLSRMQQTQHIKVAALPGDLADAAFWKTHSPDLADPRISSLVLYDAVIDQPSYANELLEGSIQEWMLAGVTGANYQLHAEENTIVVTADYTLTIAGVATVVKGRKYACKITTTDATSRSYSRLTSSLSGGEYRPTGLAAALYAAGCKVWWDGTLSITGPGCQLSIIPGHAVNVLNGAPEWATMGARVVSVSHDLDAGKTVVRLGPPRQMTIGDLASQLRRNRRRHVPASTSSRLNPDLDESSDMPQVMMGSHHPRAGSASGLALLGEESYLVTDAQLNAETNMLQIKRRKGYVVWSEAATDWTNVTGWDVTNCDEESV